MCACAGGCVYTVVCKEATPAARVVDQTCARVCACVHMRGGCLRMCVHSHTCVYMRGNVCACVYGQNHTFIGVYGVRTVFLAGKLPYIRSYTVQIYGSGQPYPYTMHVQGLIWIQVRQKGVLIITGLEAVRFAD